VTGSLGTEYRSTIVGYQLRGADPLSVVIDAPATNTAPASLSVTPTRTGGYAYSLSSVSDSAAATVGGTVTDVEAVPEGIVETTFRTVGYRIDGRTTTEAVDETYTFEESVGSDDRNIGHLVLVEPRTVFPFDSIDGTDIDFTPSNGDVLTYNSTTGLWENAAPATPSLSIDDLTDVDITTVAPTDGQVLKWVAADSEFQPADDNAGGGGGSADSLAPTFVGAVKQITTNYTAPATVSWRDVTLQAANIDQAGAGTFDGTNQFVIPTGVTQVVVSGNIIPSANSDNQFRLLLDGSVLALNQGRLAGEVNETAYTNGGESIASTLIDVTAGQVIKLQIFTNSTSVNWNGAVMIEAKTHTLGVAAPAPFGGFRATADGSTTLAVSGGVSTDITHLNTVDFDTGSGFNTTTGEYTVPAEFDGKYMTFFGNIRYTANEAGAIYFSRDTGSGYVAIAQNGHDSSDLYQISSGPILVSAGDKIKMFVFIASAGTVRNTAANNWFSGYVIDGVNAETESIIVAASDETTALTTGTAKVTFRMPYAFTLTEVRASVTTAPTDATLNVDINEGGVSILSTVLTIDSGEKTSTTAATPAVISDTALADDAEITIDIDQVGSTVAGAGLKVTLIGTKA
jgi:hypothetical protein